MKIAMMGAGYIAGLLYFIIAFRYGHHLNQIQLLRLPLEDHALYSLKKTCRLPSFLNFYLFLNWNITSCSPAFIFFFLHSDQAPLS